ncbi:SRPBCC family protein [Usitatibacter rugosus]|nr:SRPBCC family protein [Usitatibacter rugosus]
MDRSISAVGFLDGVSLVRVETSVDIDMATADVFHYATAPYLWHTWHPATAAVSNVPSRPIGLGETVRERIHVGLKRFETTWTVVECRPPDTWVIVTDSGQGVARIRYIVSPLAGGSRFTRILEYRSRVWPWRWIDSSLMRWILSRQSRRALNQLKRVLES